MDIRDKILEAKANNSYVHITAAHPYRMDWNEFISLLKEAQKQPLQDRALIYDKFDLTIPNSVHSKKLKEIYLHFQTYLSLNLFSIKTLANLVGDEGEYWLHPDRHDVITLQMYGHVEYRIYNYAPEIRFNTKNNEGLEYKSYMLKPGDIFYMKSGIIHQAVVSEPRITTILDIYNF